MGGLVTVKSVVGVGSVFTVELAAANPGPERRPQRVLANLASGAHQPGRKVVYIEDNVSNIDLVEEIFAERPDITLLTAIQGTMGISLAREHEPDVVLLDLNLPDISGEMVLERLGSDPATADIPVIVLTADATEDQEARVLSLGATAYLTKPIDVDELLRLVDGAMLAPAGEHA
jgi:CheY-like chemotaxis protein